MLQVSSVQKAGCWASACDSRCLVALSRSLISYMCSGVMVQMPRRSRTALRPVDGIQDICAARRVCVCVCVCVSYNREQRATDLSIDKCKKRYDIFKTHYPATMRLKQFFPFHLIDSMGSLEETQEAISLELRYAECFSVRACICAWVYLRLCHIVCPRACVRPRLWQVCAGAPGQRH